MKWVKWSSTDSIEDDGTVSSSRTWYEMSKYVILWCFNFPFQNDIYLSRNSFFYFKYHFKGGFYITSWALVS